jgi:hypothetical protein
MHDMKAYRDMEAEVHSFLTSEINEKVISFTPRENVPSAH